MSAEPIQEPNLVDGELYAAFQLGFRRGIEVGRRQACSEFKKDAEALLASIQKAEVLVEKLNGITSEKGEKP